MAQFSQQELMNAHVIARNNADKVTAQTAKAATVPDIVDPRRKPDLLPAEHPFGGNDNNRRVVERMLRESQSTKATPVVVIRTQAEIAKADLDAADAFDADKAPVLTDAESEAAENAAREAILAAKKDVVTGSPEQVKAAADAAAKAAKAPAPPAVPPAYVAPVA